MKSLLALGLIILLPFLAVFALVYFGIHGFSRSLTANTQKIKPVTFQSTRQTAAVS